MPVINKDLQNSKLIVSLVQELNIIPKYFPRHADKANSKKQIKSFVNTCNKTQLTLAMLAELNDKFKANNLNEELTEIAGENLGHDFFSYNMRQDIEGSEFSENISRIMKAFTHRLDSQIDKIRNNHKELDTSAGIMEVADNQLSRYYLEEDIAKFSTMEKVLLCLSIMDSNTNLTEGEKTDLKEYLPDHVVDSGIIEIVKHLATTTEEPTMNDMDPSKLNFLENLCSKYGIEFIDFNAKVSDVTVQLIDALSKRVEFLNTELRKELNTMDYHVSNLYTNTANKKDTNLGPSIEILDDEVATLNEELSGLTNVVKEQITDTLENTRKLNEIESTLGVRTEDIDNRLTRLEFKDTCCVRETNIDHITINLNQAYELFDGWDNCTNNYMMCGKYNEHANFKEFFTELVHKTGWNLRELRTSLETLRYEKDDMSAAVQSLSSTQHVLRRKTEDLEEKINCKTDTLDEDIQDVERDLRELDSEVNTAISNFKMKSLAIGIMDEAIGKNRQKVAQLESEVYTLKRELAGNKYSRMEKLTKNSFVALFVGCWLIFSTGISLHMFKKDIRSTTSVKSEQDLLTKFNLPDWQFTHNGNTVYVYKVTSKEGKHQFRCVEIVNGKVASNFFSVSNHVDNCIKDYKENAKRDVPGKGR